MLKLKMTKELAKYTDWAVEKYAKLILVQNAWPNEYLETARSLARVYLHIYLSEMVWKVAVRVLILFLLSPYSFYPLY
jgi:hypothetical protein